MSKRKTTEEFIRDAIKIHGNKYDYSKVEYIKNDWEVIITCPEHGDFKQTPNKHLLGKGCKLCGNKRISIARSGNINEFIEKSRKVHGNKYDYSLVNYKDRQTEVEIICPIHGIFKQRPFSHLHHGCQKCEETVLERNVRVFLETNGIKYIYQYKTKWLGLQSLDFYLPDYKIGIECQGGQHYFPVNWYGGEKGYQKIVERDKKKKIKCENNCVTLKYFTEEQFKKYDDKAYTDMNLLLEEINK